MIRYEQDGKFAYFNGLKFTRDDKTGYYLNSTIRKRLHRYVWEYFNGPIPAGHHIHHKDGDKNNNNIENLVLVKHSKHVRLHGILNSMDSEWLEWARDNMNKKARPAASKWHSSEEGKEWHRKHYNKMKDKLHAKVTKVCDYCGKEYEGLPRKTARFCSNKCKSAWRRKVGLDNETRTCAYCGKEFKTNKYSKTKCCSKSCSKRLYPRLPQLRQSKVN